ncbi:hypothetical protein PUMCH_002128 [Australozyma saopauloensis]|uniref:Diphthine methyltransferase n=1 Tax=Australozyma saopauloensis TaxID=291208 RepID=A0AAX4H8C9_9ASCO|nr:hypothetical protein PUMCH_002128 [[Candida] saopauloensis]
MSIAQDLISKMETAKRLAVTESKLPPCCLQIHPANTSVVYLGTYKLEKPSGLRHGSIETYDIVDGQFTLRSETKTELAILDLKFNPSDQRCLVLAHSTGIVKIWDVSADTYDLTLKQEYSITENDILVTSVFFNPLNCNELLCTLTSGEALILDLTKGDYETFDATHDLECWTGGFGQIGPCGNIVFTGGDDSKLIAHDSRTKEKVWATNHRHHDAGVVLILCPNESWLNFRPNDLWTGSYDDCLRIFDVRHLDGDDGPYLYQSLLPTETYKQNLGGGVWRLIPSPDSDMVLACCMYDGARIIKPGTSSFECVRYFKGDHESMCYGGDWKDPSSVITCSFYDNIIQQWLPTQTQ